MLFTESDKSLLAFFISKQTPVMARFVLMSLRQEREVLFGQSPLKSRLDRLLKVFGLVRSTTLKKYTDALAIQSMLMDHLYASEAFLKREDATLEEFIAFTKDAFKGVNNHKSNYTVSAFWNVHWILQMFTKRIEEAKQEVMA